ncbi:methyltransferase domain-containing protein [Salinimicrobium terrae]|uniref:methyltransferase domain-containing protein n=1 Tax=Salinimicrobium terrae TaxID=470866 RepID=UPI00041C50E3|nr:methyltransferase domain-containing protein [Salinimicrobium terrae]
MTLFSNQCTIKPILQTVLKTYRGKGLYGVKYMVKRKLEQFNIFSDKQKNLYSEYFEGKNGIEIGGPSKIFLKEIPIYQVINSLDGCNFSNETIWEGKISESDGYHYYNKKSGYQYICEASDLEVIPNERYDFLISSHCLEHCANTLKTLNEWLRVLKKGGVMLLILPDKRYTFDHNRPVTTFDHLIEDFKKDIDEHDLTHLPEILELHDLSLDRPAGTKVQFKNRSLSNFKNRCLHHHVFDFKLLRTLCSHVNVKIINSAFIKPYHQVILGVKQ